MGRIAHLKTTCPLCGKYTSIYVEEGGASAKVKCEHCRQVFEFGRGMMYKPVAYVPSIPQWAVIRAGGAKDESMQSNGPATTADDDKPARNNETNCMNCGKGADMEKVYGIIERHHYDDRHDTADLSMGTTTYTPLAIIRVRLCSECEQASRGKGRKQSVYALIAGAAMILIGILLRHNEIAGFLALFGLVVFITGAVRFGKALFSRTDAVQRLLGEKGIDPSCVIAPKTGKPVDVKRIEGTLSNRHDFQYRFIGKQSLCKPAGKERRKGSLAEALRALRAWAAEADVSRNA